METDQEKDVENTQPLQTATLLTSNLISDEDLPQSVSCEPSSGASPEYVDTGVSAMETDGGDSIGGTGMVSSSSSQDMQELLAESPDADNRLYGLPGYGQSLSHSIISHPPVPTTPPSHRRRPGRPKKDPLYPSPLPRKAM